MLGGLARRRHWVWIGPEVGSLSNLGQRPEITRESEAGTGSQSAPIGTPPSSTEILPKNQYVDAAQKGGNSEPIHTGPVGATDLK
jgi:hypothetical protein